MTLPLLGNKNDLAMPPQLELRSHACSTYYAPPLSYENPHHHHHPYVNVGAQKKTDLIDRLVETSAEIIDSIWSQQQTSAPPHDPRIKVVHTRAFIQEILRRSKTTYSNLQVCLFYLFRVKKAVLIRMAAITSQQEKKNKSRDDHIVCCGRRMFLAALMVSAKFLQDKNYRNRAWARLSGLALYEINAAEMLFLRLINYNLYISQSTFDQWHTLLQAYLYRPPSQQHKHDSCGISSNSGSCSSSHHLTMETCIACYLRTLSSHSTPFISYSSPQHNTTTFNRSEQQPSSYPSPPLTDELNNSATLTHTPTPPPLVGNSEHSNNNKREHDDDDQDHPHRLSIKRHCIDFS